MLCVSFKILDINISLRCWGGHAGLKANWIIRNKLNSITSILNLIQVNTLLQGYLQWRFPQLNRKQPFHSRDGFPVKSVMLCEGAIIFLDKKCICENLYKFPVLKRRYQEKKKKKNINKKYIILFQNTGIVNFLFKLWESTVPALCRRIGIIFKTMLKQKLNDRILSY